MDPPLPRLPAAGEEEEEGEGPLLNWDHGRDLVRLLGSGGAVVSVVLKYVCCT